jgi:hypothetical protein
MKRTLGKLILVALSALALAACQTAPAKPEPAPAPIVAKSTTDLLLEIRKAELELERTDQMAWLKFATESDSDMVKGFVMGRSAAKAPAAAASSATQTILQVKAQEDETALRREELAAKNSAWNKGLQLFDRATNIVMFSQGLKFRKFEIETANTQSRYTLDTVRGAQRDGFNSGSDATLSGVSAGSGATLGGFGAAAPAAESTATPAE